jgi:thiamine kinase-like enzyme
VGQQEESKHLTPDDLIPRIEDWRGQEVRWEELGGGITNHNYIIWVNGGPGNPGGGKYMMRVPGIGTDMFIDREMERDCMIAAAKVGVGPAVLYTIDPEGALVSDFVEGVLMHPETITGHRDRIKQIVDTVKIVHDKATFKNEIHVFDMLRHYNKIAQDLKTPFNLFPRLDEMVRNCDNIEKAMERDEPAPVAAHNDLLSENFIVDASGRMWVIDWEYGGMTDPYFDLGDFVMEHPFSREEQRFILETYCGEMDEHRFARLMLHRMTSGIWWAVWATIQHTVSHIEFDYVEWGNERLRRALEGYEDPDYPKWMEEV